VSLLPTYSLDDSSKPASHIHTLARTHAQTQTQTHAHTHTYIYVCIYIYIYRVLFLEKILESDSDTKYMHSLSVISSL